MGYFDKIFYIDRSDEEQDLRIKSMKNQIWTQRATVIISILALLISIIAIIVSVVFRCC